jgi:hypothetical protein
MLTAQQFVTLMDPIRSMRSTDSMSAIPMASWMGHAHVALRLNSHIRLSVMDTG